VTDGIFRYSRKPRRDPAIAFVERFCAGDIEGLAELLAPDPRFSGTLHSYDSAGAYLRALRRDPPEACPFEILSATEGPGAVAIFWSYQKPTRVLRMAQLFTVRHGLIHEIDLVFEAHRAPNQPLGRVKQP
jgi:hypothetical protein